MLTQDQLKIVENNISKMENVQEVFAYLNNTFDLKSTKITGSLVGPAFKSGMMKALRLLQPPLKK